MVTVGKTLMAALLSVDIVFVTVLGAKILTETKGLRLYPRLLKFYKDEFRLVLTRSDTGTEVDTGHRSRYGTSRSCRWSRWHTRADEAQH